MSEDGQRGTWTRTTAATWFYRREGQPQPYGYVVRQWDDGPRGQQWAAIVLGPTLADDVTLQQGVSCDAAKRAVEQHAAAGGRPWTPRRWW